MENYNELHDYAVLSALRSLAVYRSCFFVLAAAVSELSLTIYRRFKSVRCSLSISTCEFNHMNGIYQFHLI